jgi:hypothetical protein
VNLHEILLAVLFWRDGSTEKRNLNEDPPADKVELVRYIPQGHFEELCNSQCFRPIQCL